MATLSGNKIKDTYESLIKFNDNGTVDGSLQLLSDGAGNSIGISVDNSGNISSAAVGTLIGTSSSNVVNATILDVSGNGTSGQYLISDGDGSFSWSSGDVADDSVTYAKLADEFTTSATISASDVDWSSAAVFTKTLGSNTTLTFSNVSTGMVKDLVITGNYTLTLPTSVKEITGTYDGTVSNLIQIISTNGSTEQWATISQEAS